jgi:N-acyl-D-aspartate/D-glutamate deacylase
MLVGFQTFHPFKDRPTYRALSGLPLPARIVELRRPDVRRAILSETSPLDRMSEYVNASLDRIYPMGEPPNYEPTADMSVAAIARSEGRSPEEVLYDVMLRHDGRELLMFALLGYSHGSLDDMREMILHPNAALGLSDGGAHCGVICDASIPTFMLSHWVRDRDRGERLPLELVVSKMTRDTARLYGFGDRGVIAPGFKADLNLIDLDRLHLRLPELVFDLPGGARRLIQRAEGYEATMVAGEVTFSRGEDTGARPGALVRGWR